ncbi:MAG TPA: hypothetical protein VGS07_33110 [Thermoanaerobaculia bacterium]|jgi:hypothetical protein|nr:hypothetical protein [Thermoanaerobaculia bacterium]
MTGKPLTFAVALLFALSPFLSAAQPQLQAGDARHHIPGVTTTPAAPPLLYALPLETLDGLEHQLDFVVTENLTETLKEGLVFTSAPNALAKYPAIEILPLHPQFLARLREGNSYDEAHISVYLDGNFLEEDTFLEIAKKSLKLQRQDLFLIDVKSRSTGEGSSRLPIFSKAFPAYGCVHQCEIAAQTCESYCVSRPIPNCEDHCDSRLTNCLHTCGCPVAVGDLPTITTFLGYTPQATVCLFDVPNGNPPTDGHYYDKFQGTYKHEHYQDVVQCDDLHTNALTSVDYTFTTCFKRRTDLPGKCIPNGGQIFNQCVIN